VLHPCSFDVVTRPSHLRFHVFVALRFCACAHCVERVWLNGLVRVPFSKRSLLACSKLKCEFCSRSRAAMDSKSQATVVLDIGGDTCKIGLAGHAAPK
jgi:hypothetical protein